MPTRGRVLLDTDIIIALFNADREILAWLPQAVESLISVITVGELLRGVYGSRLIETNLARVGALLESVPVLACEIATAVRYGRIKQQLRMKGRPLPENDIWIAATAQQHQLTLVTRDRHFEQIQGLDLLLF